MSEISLYGLESTSQWNFLPMEVMVEEVFPYYFDPSFVCISSEFYLYCNEYFEILGNQLKSSNSLLMNFVKRVEGISSLDDFEERDVTKRTYEVIKVILNITALPLKVYFDIESFEKTFSMGLLAIPMHRQEFIEFILEFDKCFPFSHVEECVLKDSLERKLFLGEEDDLEEDIDLISILLKQEPPFLLMNYSYNFRGASNFEYEDFNKMIEEEVKFYRYFNGYRISMGIKHMPFLEAILIAKTSENSDINFAADLYSKKGHDMETLEVLETFYGLIMKRKDAQVIFQNMSNYYIDFYRHMKLLLNPPPELPKYSSFLNLFETCMIENYERAL